MQTLTLLVIQKATLLPITFDQITLLRVVTWGNSKNTLKKILMGDKLRQWKREQYWKKRHITGNPRSYCFMFIHKHVYMFMFIQTEQKVGNTCSIHDFFFNPLKTKEQFSSNPLFNWINYISNNQTIFCGYLYMVNDIWLCIYIFQ